jgi:hypothetical protein
MASVTPCPADDVLFQYMSGDLPEKSTRVVDEHMTTCRDCRRLVAEAVRRLPLSNPPRRRHWKRGLVWLASIALVAAAAVAMGRWTHRPGRDGADTCAGGDRAYRSPTNGQCYTRHDGPQDWNSARAACDAEGGEILTFASYTELTDVDRALGQPFRTETWIGLRRLAGSADEYGPLPHVHTNAVAQPQTDRSSRGEISWISGEPFSITNGPSWGPGEPVPGAGDCVVQVATATLHPLSHVPFRWLTAPCSRHLPYVCKRAPWIVRPATGHSYRLFLSPKTWDGARAACEGLKAHLATIMDSEEEGFVTNGLAVTAWIGATDRTSEMHFAWLTGESFSFGHFAPLEPDDSTGMNDCAVISPDRLWHDRECHDLYAFVCERD